MKRILSLILVLSTLLSMCGVLFSCKSKKDNNAETKKLNYSADVLVDFNDTSVISDCGLTAKTDNVKTASNSGAFTVAPQKSAELVFSNTDLSSYKELSVWMNNTSSADMRITFKLISDNGSTAETDFYSTVISVHPGWHQYNIPFSQMIEGNKPIKNVTVVGTPLGIKSINGITLAVLSGKGELLIDSVYGKTQKHGTLEGQNFSELGEAVCFYEGSGAYLYDQLRYVIDESDPSLEIYGDKQTSYVPLAILAQHRGVDDLTYSAEQISFTYKGKKFDFTKDSKIDFIGSPLGFNAGKPTTVTPVVVADYICIPMESAAKILGYELFYDKMGLSIFSDTQNIYNSVDSYSRIYELISDIAFENYTGAELLSNMDELYPEDTHTRLYVNQQRFDEMKELLKTDNTFASWFRRFEKIYEKGQPVYNRPMPKFLLKDGYRMSTENQIIPYAFLYKMTGNKDYAERVFKELNAFARFRDPVSQCRSWHPEHYLDVAGVMVSYAVGYDWCYDYFTPEQRKTIEDGAWECGFGASLGFGELYTWWNDLSNLHAYEDEYFKKHGEKFDSTRIGNNGAPYQIPDTENDRFKPFKFNRSNWSNNWNAVCNAGMVLMSLAFANVNQNFRDASEYLLDCCLYTIPYGLEPSYATDGGYPEGPGYWSYGTEHTAKFIACLDSATGKSFGHINAPGFRESFYFRNSIGSSTKGTWNYSDAGVGPTDSILFFWFANAVGDKSIGGIHYGNIVNGGSQLSVWDFLFYNPDVIDTNISLPLDNPYFGIDTVTFRSSWKDDTLFCGLHGGENNSPHGNLDIGTFILEYGGTRFFIDLGSDNYNTKNPKYTGGNSVIYFSNPYRYWLYREKAEGQNTLVIDPVRCDTDNRRSGDNNQGKNYDQKLSAVSDITRFESGEKSALAVVDMGCAYYELLSGERGMFVTNNRSTVVIQDELKFAGKSHHEIYWMGHVGYTKNEQGVVTSGNIVISEDKQSAIITLEGKSLLCQIVLPEGANYSFEFKTMAANYLPVTGLVNSQGETPRDGLQKLVAYSDNANGNCKFAIVCNLLSDGPANYEFTDIKNWDVSK